MRLLSRETATDNDSRRAMSAGGSVSVCVGDGGATIGRRAAASAESAALISESARFRASLAGVESIFASMRDATILALRDAFFGTRTNAMMAMTNTPAAMLPSTAALRRAFFARAAIQRYAGPPPMRAGLRNPMFRYSKQKRRKHRFRRFFLMTFCGY